MRIRWAFSVVSGVVGIACSSFTSDASTSPDGGGADGGSDGVVTGAAGDDSLEIDPPPARLFVVQGQKQSVAFHVKRGTNVDAPIMFSFQNLPPGVTATNTTLGERQANLEVQLTADAGADQKLAQVKATATTIAGDGTSVSATAQFELFLRGPAGAIDTTFGTGGKVAVDFTGFDDRPLLVVGPKDEIYTHPGAASACTGGVNCVFRYTADGAVDTTFGPNKSGQAAVPTTFAAVVQPDSRLVGVGHGATQPSLVYRLNPDGTPDSTFGDASEGAGTLGLQKIGSQFGAEAVALGSDGSLAVGFRYTVSPATPFVGIQRLNAKGAFTFFSSWGPSSALILVPSIAVKKNGHVIMAAACGQTGAATYDAQEIDTTGTVVPTFGTSGALHSTYPPYGDIEEFYGSIAYPDGSFVFPMSKRLVKINAAGQWDPTFGAAGAGYVDLGSVAYGVAGTPDGKIVVYTKTDAAGPSVLRLNTNGDFDMSFGTNGIAPIDATLAQHGRANVQSDGRILVMSSQTIIRVWN